MKKLRPPLHAYVLTEYKYRQDGTEDKVTFITDARTANEYLDLANKAESRVQLLEAAFLIVCLFVVQFHRPIVESIDNVVLKIALFVVPALVLIALYYSITKYTRSHAVCSRMANIYAGQGPSKLHDPYE
jgi:hypothetical protein